MFGRVRRRIIQWRRVAQFEPIRVEGAQVAEEQATERPSGKAIVQPGMRVALVREPENALDPDSVAVQSLDEQRLGYLPADIAAWVTPLLDSGRVAFDGRIYAVEPADPKSPPRAASFSVALTQFDLRPVERFSLVLAIRALLHLPVLGASWCFGRAAALYHAFSQTTVPPPDHYAADDRSGG
jgi:hypothetical protein